MLIVTSMLLLAAVAFLTVALVIGPIWMAWLSIATSGLAALLLAARWWRMWRARGRHRVGGAAGAAPPARSPRRASARAGAQPATAPQPDTAQSATPEPSSAAPTPGPATEGPGGSAAVRHEPVEEDTDAADVLLVCELDDEVVVVDERPRYHLAGCRWLGTRPTEPLPVREARELGFTPCVSCGPDAEIARRHRATSTG